MSEGQCPGKGSNSCKIFERQVYFLSNLHLFRPGPVPWGGVGGVTPPQELSLAIYSVKFDFWSVKLCYEVLY